MAADEEVKKLAGFLPEDARQQIFGTLLKYYANERLLADALGFDVALVKIWQSGQKLSKEHFPEMLALALQECPSQTKMAVGNALEELSFLCDGFGITEKEGQGRAGEFMDALDEEGRAIVSHLIRKGHAKIGELSALVSLNDTLTLNKINEVINPAAKRILGKPVLLFRHAGFASGKKVLFSWWIDKDMQLMNGREREMVEMTSEKDFLRVTLALPGMQENDIMVSAGNNCVSVSAKNAETAFFKKIPLYCPVKGIREKRFNNGILEIVLEKGGEPNGLYQLSKEIAKNRGSQKSRER